MGLSIVGGEPAAKDVAETDESPIRAPPDPDRPRKPYEGRRRRSAARLAQRQPQRALGVSRLRRTRGPHTPLLKPLTERRPTAGPAEAVLHYWGIAPGPDFELRVQHNRLSPLAPARAAELPAHHALDLRWAGVFATTSVSIKQHHGMCMRRKERTKELSRLPRAPGIVVGMHVYLEAEATGGQSSAPLNEPRNDRAEGLVRHEDDEVYLKIVACHHPSTPPPNRTPRSTSPLQCLSLGCLLPGITSAPPSADIVKHRTSSGLTRPTTAGECVATRTWPS